MSRPRQPSTSSPASSAATSLASGRAASFASVSLMGLAPGPSSLPPTPSPSKKNSLRPPQSQNPSAGRDCGATVLGLDGNATANCSSIDSRYLGDACTANCSQGYLGGTRDFTCDPSGVWVHPLGLDYCYPESEPCAVEVGRVDDVTDPKATLQTQYIEARLECPAG